jgi:hypothetical protein
MIVIPAIHNLDNENAPEQKGWGWHKVSELIEAINYHLTLNGGEPVTPVTLYARYGYLNKTLDSLGVGVVALPTRKGVLGDELSEFITPNIDLSKTTFVPAGWGCNVLSTVKVQVWIKIPTYAQLRKMVTGRG